MSEITTSDQDTVTSLRELTAKVQDLCNILTRENPGKSREKLKEKDTVVNMLHEQINNGRPEKILDWEKVELMAVDDIEKENEQYTQKLENFWKETDESTQTEKEKTTQAYASAFSRFAEIYHLLGWRGTADDEADAMFDESVLTDSRGLLLESIFRIEVFQMSRFGEMSERSRALFELSRLPRLLLVLVRIASRQVYIVSACGADKVIRERPFDAGTVIKVLALVARILKGGHLVSSVSLEKLLCSCYERRLLDQPNIDDVETFQKQCELVYDCITALDFTKRYREIREPLCALFYMRCRSESIQQLFDRIRAHEEATVGIDGFPELPLQESTGSTFHPEIFSIRYLQDFGGLKIEWTDSLTEHLKIYANRNAIRIFAHPTFFYNAIDLNSDAHDYTHATYFELGLTYALLFRPTSSSNIRRLKQYTTAGEEQQIRWHKLVTFDGHPIHHFTPPWDDKPVDTTGIKQLDINPLRHPTRDILSESFYRCSLPPSIQVALNIASPDKSVKGITLSWNQHKLTSTSMQQLTASSLPPTYPEDIKFMILSIMENDMTETESFVRFPYFESRLRRVKMYLDSRQPTSMRELWVDRRDFRAWWVFWGGAFMGMALVGILGLQLASLWCRAM